MSKYYIGIDGGGTKTQFIMANKQGEIVADIVKKQAHYLMIGFDGLEKVIQEGVQECLDQVSCSMQDIAFCAVCICGYGDVKKHDLLIEQAIDHALAEIPHQVYSDTLNAHQGSLAGKRGIHVIAGTGSIAFGIDKNGNCARSGGWNHLFGGDEGSAYWLACKMLLAFTRQSDNRDQKTALYYDLKEKYHFQEDGELIDYTVVDLNFDRSAIANMAKDLYALAQKKDPAALKIYQEAAKEIFEMIHAIATTLQFDKPIPISYSGGVFQSQHYILGPLQEYCSPYAYQLEKPQFNPAIGSLIVAYSHDQISLTEVMKQNLVQTSMEEIL